MLKIEEFDTVVVTPDNANSLGYESSDLGPTGEVVAVQYQGQWHAWANNIKHAKDIVTDATGTQVIAVRDQVGQRWKFEPAEEDG